ncbi:hypothetical protein CW304_17480 [Bacillus sp. UFRGS-B20]|nr:hypothetical protein CW304_17480 [Bacillus sp. UFRGS-B20]
MIHGEFTIIYSFFHCFTSFIWCTIYRLRLKSVTITGTTSEIIVSSDHVFYNDRGFYLPIFRQNNTSHAFVPHEAMR